MSIYLIIIFKIVLIHYVLVEVESTAHFFLHCHHYHSIKAKLLNSLEVIDTNLLNLSEEQLIKVLLYYFSQLDRNQNTNVLNSSINYIVIMSPSPPGIRGGGWFLCHQPGRGATAKLQEPGWRHNQGKDDFRQSSRGVLLYHNTLLVFPQNASPWILQILPAVLSYIFLTFS